MRDLEFGARLKSSGVTQFRFWAPDCREVDLVIEDKLIPMVRNNDDIFSVDADCLAGTQYAFCLDRGLIVPDPASRAQADDVHSNSVVVSSAYNWQHVEWHGRPWSETIIYELHAGSFGGFIGVTRELARLAALGITAIELMPIADFPGRRNWGYDGVLPYAPDAVYGTPSELKTLIDTAHGFGLQVFLDVVYNHFGPDGNYLGTYAKKFFRDDIHTPWGNAIDFRQRQVRRFFIENALYWIHDYRFDGLRFDAVHAITDDTFLVEMAAEIRARTKDRHVHLILENENNDANLLRITPVDQTFDAQWTDDWHHCLHVLLTGESEGYYGDFQNPASQLARCLEQGFSYQGEPSPHANGVARGTPSSHLPTTAFVICLQNHDQIGNRAMGQRLATLAKPEALRAAASLLLLTPQIPMLFMGEEWGETKPFLFFTDHHGVLADAVRQGRRKEFSKFEAFTNPETREKIPDPNDPATYKTSIAEPPANHTPEQAQTVELYRHLIELRTMFIVPHLINTVSLGAITLNGAGIRAAWRLGNGQKLIIGANFGGSEVACPHSRGRLLFRSAKAALAPDTLPPHATFAWLEEA